MPRTTTDGMLLLFAAERRANDGQTMVYDGRNLAAVAVRMVSAVLLLLLLVIFAVCRQLKRFFVLPFSAIQSTLLTGWRAAKSSAMAGAKDGLY